MRLEVTPQTVCRNPLLGIGQIREWVDTMVAMRHRVGRFTRWALLEKPISNLVAGRINDGYLNIVWMLLEMAVSPRRIKGLVDIH